MHLYDLCKTRNICEGGDEMEKMEENQENPDEPKKVRDRLAMTEKSDQEVIV